MRGRYRRRGWRRRKPFALRPAPPVLAERLRRVVRAIGRVEAERVLLLALARVRFPEPGNASRLRRHRWLRAQPRTGWEAAYAALRRLRGVGAGVRALLARQALQEHPEPSRAQRRSRWVRARLAELGLARYRGRARDRRRREMVSPPQPPRGTTLPPSSPSDTVRAARIWAGRRRQAPRGEPWLARRAGAAPRRRTPTGLELVPWRTAEGRLRHLPPYLSPAELVDRLRRPLTPFEVGRAHAERRAHVADPARHFEVHAARRRAARRRAQATEKLVQVRPGLRIHCEPQPVDLIADALRGLLECGGTR